MLLVARMLLVVMPFVTSSDALAPSSFLLLVVLPGATSSVLATIWCIVTDDVRTSLECALDRYMHETHKCMATVYMPFYPQRSTFCLVHACLSQYYTVDRYTSRKEQAEGWDNMFRSYVGIDWVEVGKEKKLFFVEFVLYDYIYIYIYRGRP